MNASLLAIYYVWDSLRCRKEDPSAIEPQGQRTLSLFDCKDLHQEVVVPAGDFAFAFDAVFRRMLLQ